MAAVYIYMLVFFGAFLSLTAAREVTEEHIEDENISQLPVKQSVGDGIVMNGSGDYINSPTLSYDVGL
jgi:hypothetical protein